ncbi:hypothetical protein BCR36DRAFT_579635 [Piromyces finnis]|uniref:Phox-like protein n=1 Tax=Piromyces finnis TaxID=1754191 RepID=A0A1Y1VMQ5_9FUNG|nr:hypothetical protein BCR36DRAFT_579635 [Piromyces finnis]|eukprot:ORX60188.1 hypothetical protein BCR36DRAFT_579635 [Piromyces finnis]
MEKILKITIPTCSQRQKSKPYIVYHITISSSFRTWTIQHRYSEFFSLNKRFLDLGLKPPLELPQKSSIFSFTSYDNPKFVETRRQGLEEYLQAILASKDERFKKLLEWKEFLGISQSKVKPEDEEYSVLCTSMSTTSNDIRFNDTGGYNSCSFDITSSEQWLEECRNLDLVINEIRTCIAARNKFVTRNETAAACEATVLARKNHNILCTKYAELERELHLQVDDFYNNAQQQQEDNSIIVGSSPSFFSSVLGTMKKQKSKMLLSKSELSRRQDLLENIRTEKIQLEKLLANTKFNDSLSQNNISDKVYFSAKSGSNRQSNSLENSFGSNSGIKHNTSAKSRRKFGIQISQEVEESTQGLDNTQILQLQKNMLKDQDKTLEQFSAILNRQRKIGETINQELDFQNELLDDLDGNVNKVQLGLGQAEKRMKKVLKK